MPHSGFINPRDLQKKPCWLRLFLYDDDDEEEEGRRFIHLLVNDIPLRNSNYNLVQIESLFQDSTFPYRR